MQTLPRFSTSNELQLQLQLQLESDFAISKLIADLPCTFSFVCAVLLHLLLKQAKYYRDTEYREKKITFG